MSSVKAIFPFVFLIGLWCLLEQIKRPKLVAGFSLSCHVFNRLSVCRGIASCLSASLSPHACFHVRHDGKTFSRGTVWVSHINHSAFFFILFFGGGGWSSFQFSPLLSPKCNFSLATERATHPTRQKHVTNVSRSILFPVFALEKRIRNLSNLTRNTFLCFP